MFNLIVASDEYTLITADIGVIGVVIGAVLWAFIARSCQIFENQLLIGVQKLTLDLGKSESMIPPPDFNRSNELHGLNKRRWPRCSTSSRPRTSTRSSRQILTSRGSLLELFCGHFSPEVVKSSKIDFFLKFKNSQLIH